MNHVEIYSQSQSAAQSGKAKVIWLIKPKRPSAQMPELLMGWTQSADTLNQVKLQFPTQYQAEEFAKSQGWRYTVSKQNFRKTRPRTYLDNFIYEAGE